MTIETTRAQIIANVWQAIAQSGADLTGLTTEQQEKLVGKIADQMMLTFDQLLDEAAPVETTSNEAEEDQLEEKLLWQGRPFLSLVEHYRITSERIKVVRGLLGKDIENFELIRIQDIDFSQGLHERMLKIGDIEIRGQDPSNPKLVLRNVPDPEAIYEMLRRAWLEARKRHGLQFREYM